MRRALGLLAVAAVLAVGTPAGAQTYPLSAPAPKTTDAAALRGLAVKREIHERFGRGIEALGRSDWSLASEEFARIVELGPAEPQGSTARYDLALAEIGLRHYDRAIALLEGALRLDPGFAAAAANIVNVYLLQNDLGRARAAADRFVAIAPQAARALYSRGLIALRTGDTSTALADFRALLNANPAYALAHYDLALAEVQNGRLSEAERELNQALTLAPSFARARIALGTIQLRQGRRDEARRAFEEASRDAQDPALRNLALSLRDQLTAP
jgi:tetratricopeptide (TPR) repeat protein